MQYKNNKNSNRNKLNKLNRNKKEDVIINSNSNNSINNDTTNNNETNNNTKIIKNSLLDYKLFVIDLSMEINNIFDYDENPKYSINIDYPKFAYGFQHYIHANKNKMEKLKQFENRKKVYRVMNNFETNVDNYNNDIAHMSKIYFNINENKPDILSRGFYKLWEILFMFDLIDVDLDNFTSAHLAEGPGSFIQATMFFRDKFSKKSKNDKYYAITLHSEDTKNYVPELENKFVDYYGKEKPLRFILHKTVPKTISRQYKSKDNGDLTNPKTIKLFGGQLKEKVDFITADGGFNWLNENTQEQEAFKLIFSQILSAIKFQKKKGNFICKFFETYTITSIKFISILKQFYNKIYVVKPLLSRPSNSEKYVICMDFKYDDNNKNYKTMLDKLTNIHKLNHKNINLNLVDIFPDYIPDKNLIDYMIYINIEIANIQYKSLNEINEFIDSQNYYGDVYLIKRDLQILANKYWINKFYIDIKDFYNNVKDIRNEVIKLTQNYNVLINENLKFKI